MSEHQFHQPSWAPSQTQTQVKKGKGCWFWGCFGCFGTTIILMVLAGLGANAMLAEARKYTSATPRELPPYELEPGRYDEVTARVESFKAALDKEEAVTLKLTADDLNALVAGSDDREDFTDHLRFSSEGGELTAEASIPLDEIPFFEGYLNGKVSLRVGMMGETLWVTATSIETEHGPVPAEFLQGLAGHNLAQGIQSDPELAPWIRQLSDVRIEDGTLILESSGR